MVNRATVVKAVFPEVLQSFLQVNVSSRVLPQIMAAGFLGADAAKNHTSSWKTAN